MDIIQSLGYADLFAQVETVLRVFFAWFPIWAPLVLGSLFWQKWMDYVRAQFISKMSWVLLEIKLPKETYKSPLAMEIALNSLYQTSAGTWFDKTWKGKVKDWFSLEMVSIEGNIKFFIRTTKTYKNVIEAQLYAQYPDIEIYEVPDYVRYVDYQGKKGDWEVIGGEYGLSKDDPYPIKTYIDYGLDKDPKEEYKIDPLTAVIEYLGSAGKGEQIWIQILVQATGKRYRKKDGSMGDWKDQAKDVIAKITTKEEDRDGKKVKVSRILEMTEGEREIIKSIERSVNKLGFDCGIRALYLVKKEKFNASNMKALGGLLRPFTTNNLNGFGLTKNTFGFDFPWQDYNGIRMTKKRKELFEAYKHRGWFYDPFKNKPFVLTTEELATIYHFPGGVAQTPTFGRIASRKSEAPVNLPI